MSAEHIQGRLEYGEDCDSEWWIARVGSTEQIAYTVPVRPGVARANARRLVACWNALQDFSTEALEHRSHLLKAEDDQIAMLTTQRDELLEALKKTAEHIEAMMAHIKPLRFKQHCWQQARNARAAIAKAEGGAA